MADLKHFFTYRLLAGSRTKRIGKGGVLRRSNALAQRYLRDAYPERGWSKVELEWHDTESAALKGEVRKIENYERQTGSLPPWNERRGGGGGQVYVSCKGLLADGRPCRNLAIAGNYGYCGVHR